MIGERIESRPGLPLGALFMVFLALVSIAFAVLLRSVHPLMLAILPACLGIALFLTRPRRFAAEIAAEELKCESPPLDLAYEHIEGLVMHGSRRDPRARLTIYHRSGILPVPARLSKPSNEFFEFLQSRVSANGSSDVNPLLAGYLQRQQEAFGSERVFTYRARRYVSAGPNRRAAIIFAAMAAAAGSWIALASAMGPRDYEPWLIFGILLALVFSFSALAIWFSSAGPRIRNWQLSSLVIGPAGLAMVQGDMRGELRWTEVRRMRCARRQRIFKWTIAALLQG